MADPRDLFIVIPSRLGVGEPFPVKVKVLGETREIPAAGAWNTPKPGLRGPFNLNVQREIQYVDDVLPAWAGRLEVSADGGLEGPAELIFDGADQGVFPGDTRPIRVSDGFTWSQPGLHFVRVRDPASGVEGWSNPACVTQTSPGLRLFWGDPHWQTFFSDGLRCPEELYHFARHEAFLDFGAISDHMEGVTDRQWDYFMAVTNDCNRPGEFATLIGQEWTHHDKRHGAPGHRNVYFRGGRGPIIRSNEEDCNSLAKLWAKLDAFGQPALAIPHHSANVIMGVDWEQGWHPIYERAVEVCSVWGSSEKSEAAGNPRPIRACGGEMAGRHVIDALGRGYRFGFVGGGDVHDGRPGLAMHEESYPEREQHKQYPQGLAAVWAPQLTREHIFDAIRDRRTYATTNSRIYLEVEPARPHWRIRAASEDGVQRLVLVTRAGETEIDVIEPGCRVVQPCIEAPAIGADDFAYLRVETTHGEMAWSSPRWGDQP